MGKTKEAGDESRPLCRTNQSGAAIKGAAGEDAALRASSAL